MTPILHEAHSLIEDLNKKNIKKDIKNDFGNFYKNKKLYKKSSFKK